MPTHHRLLRLGEDARQPADDYFDFMSTLDDPPTTTSTSRGSSATRLRLLRLLVLTTKLVEVGLIPSTTSRIQLRLVELHQQTVAAPSMSATASSMIIHESN